MFVKEIICGKGCLGKRLNIQGRGKYGIIRIPKCSVKIKLEEKTPEDWYKLILSGKSPEGAGYLLKTMMVQSDVDFAAVNRLSQITTSKGRHYRKTQFKRLVQLVLKENARKGIKMSR